MRIRTKAGESGDSYAKLHKRDVSPRLLRFDPGVRGANAKSSLEEEVVGPIEVQERNRRRTELFSPSSGPRDSFKVWHNELSDR
jgi:hypothetical protein